MISKSEKLQRAGRAAVKKSLIEDGWKVLFENRNSDEPVDIRAVKGFDKILVHIMLNSNGGTGSEELERKLSILKKRADESNAYAFKVKVEMDKDENLKDIHFSQLV
ncbi:MAG: hypothetical protein ACMUHU_01430 [Thermoplasmatota archaeon]